MRDLGCGMRELRDFVMAERTSNYALVDFFERNEVDVIETKYTVTACNRDDLNAESWNVPFYRTVCYRMVFSRIMFNRMVVYKMLFYRVLLYRVWVLMFCT